MQNSQSAVDWILILQNFTNNLKSFWIRWIESICTLYREKTSLKNKKIESLWILEHVHWNVYWRIHAARRSNGCLRIQALYFRLFASRPQGDTNVFYLNSTRVSIEEVKNDWHTFLARVHHAMVFSPSATGSTSLEKNALREKCSMWKVKRHLIGSVERWLSGWDLSRFYGFGESSSPEEETHIYGTV